MGKFKNWLFLPLLLSIILLLIFTHLSTETARLNQYLAHLKYTDHITLWWSKGDSIEFYCVPDDAEKIMKSHGKSISPKQAIYTTFTMKRSELLAATDPVRLITEKVAKQAQNASALHKTNLSWDQLYAKAAYRHSNFRSSSLVRWISLAMALLSGLVLGLWWKGKFILGGAFICLLNLILSGWWFMNPPPALNSPEWAILWEMSRQHLLSWSSFK